MPQFAVQVRSQGKIKEIEVNAATPEIAKRQAKRFGTPVAVRKRQRNVGGSGLSLTERYIFLWRLSTMLASKVGATESLRLLRDSFSGRIAQVSASLLEKVEVGTDLPTAISDDKKNFPGAIGMIVKVGAASGQTWMALRTAADFEKRIDDARKSSGKGLGSAIGSFVMAGALMLFSTFYIGPWVKEMDLMKGRESPILELVDVISLVCGLAMALAMVLMMGLFWLATVGRTFMPLLADAIILRIPFYNEMILSQENYINMFRMSLLVRSGVRMEDALKTSWESCRPGALKEDFKRALESVKVGRKWAAAMTMLHPTDRAALMLASDREQIAANLDNIGQQYQQIYIQRVSAFTPIMTVVSALSMSLAGLIIFMQTIMPMLEVSVDIAK